MAGEATVTFVGNIGRDPEVRVTPSGTIVCSVSVAVTGKKKKGDTWEDGPTSWFRVNVWGREGENVAEHVTKGERVAVQGRLTMTEYEKDGVKKTLPEVDADFLAVLPKPLPKVEKKEDEPW